MQPQTYLREARAVATTAEARKREKYALLSRSHHFVPVAIKTSGTLGPDTLSLLSDIGRRPQTITHYHQSISSFLLPESTPAWQYCLCIGHLKCYVIYIVYPVYVYTRELHLKKYK
ncbi:hypothetical protein EMCRGX_G032129 [Ephydatia muelleri]